MKSSEGTKKDEARYTIRFNPADPRHKRAMAALDAAGRRKATLIADAVCEYLAHHSGDEVVAPMFYAKHSKQVIALEPDYAMAYKYEKAGPVSEEKEIVPDVPTSELSSQTSEPLSNECTIDSVGASPTNDIMRLKNPLQRHWWGNMRRKGVKLFNYNFSHYHFSTLRVAGQRKISATF